MTQLYRIYCITEGGWQTEWRDDEPSECPNDSGHTVNVNSASRKKPETVVKRFEFSSQRFKRNQLKTNSWKKITTYSFPGTDDIGYLKKISFVNRMNSYNGKKNDTDLVSINSFGYYFRIYDKTNQQIIYDSSYLGGNTVENSKVMKDINHSFQSTGEALWELCLKRVSNTGDLYIEGFDFYFYKV